MPSADREGNACPSALRMYVGEVPVASVHWHDLPASASVTLIVRRMVPDEESISFTYNALAPPVVPTAELPRPGPACRTMRLEGLKMVPAYGEWDGV